MTLSDNAKFGYTSITISVLAFIAAEGNRKRAQKTADPELAADFRQSAATARALSQVGTLGAIVALYRGGWKKTAGLGLGIVLGELTISAYLSNRRLKSLPAAPAVAGYYPPYQPSASAPYPYPFAAYPDPVW